MVRRIVRRASCTMASRRDNTCPLAFVETTLLGLPADARRTSRAPRCSVASGSDSEHRVLTTPGTAQSHTALMQRPSNGSHLTTPRSRRRAAATPAYYLQRPAHVWLAALDRRSPARPSTDATDGARR